MRSKSIAALTMLSLALGACGAGDGGSPVEIGDDEPVLQIASEGGFAPVEVVLNVGPRYTLLGDGRLITLGFQTLEYPGRLVPPYMVSQLTSGQVDEILASVERIGLPEIDAVTDDSAMEFVADATTEVVTYWDGEGEHRLAVYALGMEESPSDRNAAFLELISTLDSLLGDTPAEPYEAERVRVIAGPGSPDVDFDDLREWPLESTDLTAWQELANGWQCTTFDASVLTNFEDATQATIWEHPDGQGEYLKLLVRPLHPGEPDCPS